MAVREYIGARYIMKFADPLEHDSTLTYEPLTVVQHVGASYISRQYVPAGIDISNTNYWLILANYNVQIEQYRREVAELSDTVDDHTAQLSGTQSSGLKTLIDNAVTEINSDIDNLSDSVEANTDTIAQHTDQLAGTVSSGLKTLIDNLSDSVEDNSDTIAQHTDQLAGTVSSGLKTLIDDNSDDISNLQDSDTTQNAQLAGTQSSGLKTMIDNVSGTIGTTNAKADYAIERFIVLESDEFLVGASSHVVKTFTDAELEAVGINPSSLTNYMIIASMFTHSANSPIDSTTWSTDLSGHPTEPMVPTIIAWYNPDPNIARHLSVQVKNNMAEAHYFKFKLVFMNVNGYTPYN